MVVAFWRPVTDLDDGHEAARQLLCEVLEDMGMSYRPEDFPRRPGRPPVVREAFHLSISHTAGLVAAAVSEGPVGVDVQADRRISDRLWDLYLRPCVPEGVDRVVAWVWLEAIAKSGLTSVLSARDHTVVSVEGTVSYRGQPAGRVGYQRVPGGYAAVFSADLTAGIRMVRCQGR